MIRFALWKALSDTVQRLDLREATVVQRTQSGGITTIKVREDGGMDHEDSSGGDECRNQQDLIYEFKM